MKKQSTCKFCGAVVNSGHTSCRECTAYCMTKCEIASSTEISWHKEPCTSCEHNPYNRKPGGRYNPAKECARKDATRCPYRGMEMEEAFDDAI